MAPSGRGVTVTVGVGLAAWVGVAVGVGRGVGASDGAAAGVGDGIAIDEVGELLGVAGPVLGVAAVDATGDGSGDALADVAGDARADAIGDASAEALGSATAEAPGDSAGVSAVVAVGVATGGSVGVAVGTAVEATDAVTDGVAVSGAGVGLEADAWTGTTYTPPVPVAPRWITTIRSRDGEMTASTSSDPPIVAMREVSNDGSTEQPLAVSGQTSWSLPVWISSDPSVA